MGHECENRALQETENTMNRRLDLRRVAEGVDVLDHEYLLDYESDWEEHVDIRMLRN